MSGELLEVPARLVDEHPRAFAMAYDGALDARYEWEAGYAPIDTEAEPRDGELCAFGDFEDAAMLPWPGDDGGGVPWRRGGLPGREAGRGPGGWSDGGCGAASRRGTLGGTQPQPLHPGCPMLVHMLLHVLLLSRAGCFGRSLGLPSCLPRLDAHPA